jgi:hypothetical protein
MCGFYVRNDPFITMQIVKHLKNKVFQFIFGDEIESSIWNINSTWHP